MIEKVLVATASNQKHSDFLKSAMDGTWRKKFHFILT